MADAQLKINILADGTQAVTTLKQVSQAVTDTGKATKDTEKTYEVFNNTLNQSSGYIRQQKEAVQNLATAERQLASASTSAAVGMAEVSTASGGVVAGVNAAYGAIRKLAYVLPGIGIGGIVSLLFEGISSALSSIGGSTKEVQAASDALEAYNKIAEQVIGNNSKEAATVDILVGKIQSGTLSRQETVTAIKELQKIAPDYFGKLDAETAKISDVTRAYGLYNEQITKTIEAQIRIAEITDLVKQRLTLSAANPEGTKFIDDLIAQGKTLEQINAVVVKGTADDIRAQAQLAQSSKFVTDEQAKQVLLQSQVPAGAAAILAIRQKELDLLKQINGADITHLVNLGKSPGAAKEDDTKIKFNGVKFPLDLDTSNFDPADVIDSVEKKLNKGGGLKLTITPTFTEDQIDLLQRTKALGEKISDVLTHAAEKGIIDISESLGQAIATGDFSKAGAKVVAEIGSVIEELGKALIAFAGVKIAIDLAGKSLNPYVALAAGVAAVIAGAALTAAANKPRAFASGGIVTGPTLGLVGEAGPEAVVPLDRLNSFARNAGSPSTNIAGTFRISGNDLKLVLARANKNQGLV